MPTACRCDRFQLPQSAWSQVGRALVVGTVFLAPAEPGMAAPEAAYTEQRETPDFSRALRFAPPGRPLSPLRSLSFPATMLAPSFAPLTPPSSALASLPAPANNIPPSFAPEARAAPDFADQTRRPMGQPIFDALAGGLPAEDPLLHQTTVWQRLSEYRSRDRVRLLTLWESGAGAVSLQAGKRGSPSLQWTSRRMNRGGATRGLLDHLFSISLERAHRSLHSDPRVQNEPVNPVTTSLARKDPAK